MQQCPRKKNSTRFALSCWRYASGFGVFNENIRGTPLHIIPATRLHPSFSNKVNELRRFSSFCARSARLSLGNEHSACDFAIFVAFAPHSFAEKIPYLCLDWTEIKNDRKRGAARRLIFVSDSVEHLYMYILINFKWKKIISC